MLKKEIPFLRLSVPLCLGIISGCYFRPDTIFVVSASVLTIAGFLASLLFNRYLVNTIFGISMNIALFLTGIVLYENEKNSLSDLDPSPGTYLCTASGYPEEKENSMRLTAKVNGRVSGKIVEPVNGSMLVYLRKDSSLRSICPGDRMIINCTPVRIINRGNPDEFDYRFYMENHGIKYYTFAGRENIKCRIKPDHIRFRYKALIIREKIIGMYRERGLSGEPLALVAAITLGQRSMLDPEQKQSFIRAGVMHIMAVSGLHAMIISLFIYHMLFFLKGKLIPLRIIITIVFLWLFAYLTGLAPSVMRAAFMYSFLQSGKIMHRDVNSINSVLASAFIILIIRPSSVFDAGFLLSYSAVIFIICFYQGIYQKIDLKNRFIDRIWQSAAVTLSAQAGTLPLTIALFNRFPALFLITNLIIVPMTSLLIIMGCLIPLTYPLKFISFPLAKLLSILAEATGFLTEKFSSLPFSSIENIGLWSTGAILLFMTIFLLLRYLTDRKSIRVMIPLVSFLVFILAGTIKHIWTKRSGEIIVYNTAEASAVGIRRGKVLRVYASDTVKLPEVERQAAAEGLKTSIVYTGKSARIITAGKMKILLTGSLTSPIPGKYYPEIIVLAGKAPGAGRFPALPEQVKAVIFTEGLNDFPSGRKPADNKNPVKIHYIKRSGAWRMKL